MYQLVCFGVWNKREEAEEGSVLKLWPLLLLQSCPRTQSSPVLSQASVPGPTQAKCLAAQGLAAGQGIVLVLGEGDDYTQAEAMQPREGPSRPQISVLVMMGTIKVVLASSEKNWIFFFFFYSEPFLVTPKTVT